MSKPDLYLIASLAGLTAKGLTDGCPIAAAMRSERPWSTAAHTETRKQFRNTSITL